MHSLLWLFNTVISIYIWIVIANIALSWLIQFGIVNARQPFVQQVGEFLFRATEPALSPIRRRMPNLGGIDLGPMVLIIALMFTRMLVNEMFISMMRAL